SNLYTAFGSSGLIFAGASLAFDDGNSGTYNVDFPDVIGATGGSTLAMTYTSGGSNGAATQYSGTSGQKIVMMAFPFETITSPANRNLVMADVLGFFGLANPSATPSAPDLTATGDTGLSTSD